MTRSSSRPVAGTALLALWLALQWQMFSGFVAREVAWAYPPSFDQVASLARTYETDEIIRTRGLAAGIRDGVAMSGASNSIHPVQTALATRTFGRTRLSALGVNFAYFAVMQIALVGALLHLSGRWRVAALGMGLLLCARSPFSPIGGLDDLRLDSPAASAMGVLVATVVCSGAFASRSWSLTAALVAAVVVMVRTVTLVYLGGVGAAFATIVWWRGRRDPGGAWRSRLVNLMITGVVLALVALPFVVAKWRLIYSYYVVGHVTGPDRLVYAPLLGLRGTADLLLFYPLSFLRDHAGARLLTASAVVLGVLAALGWRRPATAGVREATTELLLFAALALLVPIAVLTADTAKSPVVASITLGPAVWLVMLSVIRVAGAVRGTATTPTIDKALGLLAIAVMGLGVHAQWNHFHAPGRLQSQRADVEAVKALHGGIAQASRALDWPLPSIVVDRLAESLVPSLVTTEAAERHGFFQKVRFGLWQFGAVDLATAAAAVSKSDFVVLTSAANLTYPFDKAMHTLRPELQASPEWNHVSLSRHRIHGMDVEVFVRPYVRVHGQAGALIAQDGVRLTALGAALVARPVVEVEGSVDVVDGAPLAVMKAADAGDAMRAIPVETLSVEEGKYRLRLRVPLEIATRTPIVELRMILRGGRFRIPRSALLAPSPD